MCQPDKAIYLCLGSTVFIRHCSSLSRATHLHSPLMSNLLSTSPPHLHHLPLALFFFYLFSFVSCPSVLAIECRSLMTLMKSGGRWVINKLFANVCMSALLCFCSVCLCVCACAHARVSVCIYMLIQVFKSSYYCVTPAPYLHAINMQATTDRNRTSFSLKIINFTNVSSTKGSLLT